MDPGSRRLAQATIVLTELRGVRVLRRSEEIAETLEGVAVALHRDLTRVSVVPEHGRQRARVGRDRRVLAVCAPALDVEAVAVDADGVAVLAEAHLVRRAQVPPAEH